MNRNFSSLGIYSIAEATIDESEIHGMGGASAPILTVPVKLHVLHGELKPNEGIELISLEGELSHDSGIRLRSHTCSVNRFLIKSCHTQKEQCYLEFFLDANRLAALETRRGTGDVKFRIDLRLKTSKLIALNQGGTNQPLANPVWGYEGTWELTLQDSLIIPRNTWLSNVLPRTGYGTIHIVEFPATPVESCLPLEQSFKALQQATEKHKLGFYDDAAAKCRLAIEPFFEFEKIDPNHPDSRTRPVLKKSWEHKLGAATYAWLKHTLGSIKEASNISHHSPNAHYSQLDSQMILAVTTAVVAYIARSFKQAEL